MYRKVYILKNGLLSSSSSVLSVGKCVFLFILSKALKQIKTHRF